MTWKQRFEKAHQLYQENNYPSATRDFGYLSTTYPDVRKSNGLTMMIMKFLTYNGHRATRVNVSGRLVEKAERQDSGITLMTKKFISSSTRKGSADVSSTINGRSAMFEIKVGKDKPRPEQLREQEIERRAGGIYEFIYTPDEFLQIYDKIIASHIL